MSNSADRARRIRRNLDAGFVPAEVMADLGRNSFSSVLGVKAGRE